MRFLAALPLVVALVLAVLVPAPSSAEVRRADLARALEVLHAWDDRRAWAWAEVDEPALRSLYLPGSAAGRADLRLLRAYADRGLVVRRLVTQVFAARLLDRGATAMRLRVHDRVAGGEVVRDGQVAALPSSPPVTRDIELRLGAGGWRVAEVTGSGRDPREAQR